MQFGQLNRRSFITLLGGTTTWPLAARAQQPMPVIGFLGGRSRSSSEFAVAAFNQGLRDQGYIEGRNVAIEYRWSDGQYDRMSGIAAEFVQRRGTVSVALAGTPTAQAAKTAT